MTHQYSITKTLLLTLAFFSIASLTFAQPPGMGHNKEAMERIEAARIGFITQKLDLSSEQAEKFWPVFNEYSKKRMAFRDDFKNQFEGKRKEDLTDEDKIKIMDHQIEVKEKELALSKEYKSKFLEILSVDQMIALNQAEDEFRKMLMDKMRDRGRHDGRHEERDEMRENKKPRRP